ncbi:MAG: helix-turn-helix domain-containing protein, partial [Actinobacteria bacterium]|nr:helix-turn-helix domain-containing protein [Actinomycetota bacterium]
MDDQPDRSGAAEPGGTYQIRALTRGLALLSCFRARSGDRSLSELAAQTGLDKSTAL